MGGTTSSVNHTIRWLPGQDQASPRARREARRFFAEGALLGLGGDQLVQHGHEVSQRELNEDGALLAVLGEVVLAILGRHFAQIVFGLLAGEVALGQPQRSVPVAVRLQILTGIFDLERKDNGIIITPTYKPLTTLYFGS